MVVQEVYTLINDGKSLAIVKSAVDVVFLQLHVKLFNTIRRGIHSSCFYMLHDGLLGFLMRLWMQFSLRTSYNFMYCLSKAGILLQLGSCCYI